jgi:sterol desaturase/sphingolipid hydroxylase (fatty acid hydroxylase superfamily)
MLNLGATFDDFFGMEGISLAVFIALAWIERVATRRSLFGRPPAELVTDLCYWLSAPILRQFEKVLVATGLAAAAVWLDAAAPNALAAGYGPLSRLPLPLAALVAIMISELASYWLHRAMHRVPFLWRFHAVHHSSPTIRWSSAGRTHPLNEVVNYLSGVLPCLAVGLPLRAVVSLLPVMTLWSVMSHSDLKWNFGRLGGWLVSPRLHRWHHTPSTEGGNMNFANILSIWDRVFGTFYLPTDREPVRFGLDDAPLPENYLKQLISPFQPTRRPEVTLPTTRIEQQT